MQGGYVFPHSSPLPPEGEEEADAQKYTKDEVNYRPAGSSETNCGSCAHYLGDNVCEVVAGLVNTTFVSDAWEPRTDSLIDLV